MTATLQERRLRLADGRHIALLDNGQEDRPLLVALHGWLDNGASFLPLAPWLGAFHLVCVDLPGHGHSDHKSTPYVFVDWLDDLYQITQAAGWQRFILLGHSLGALIASAYAGVFPEQIERLILLEGLGPLSQPDEEVPGQLRRAILNRTRGDVRHLAAGSHRLLEGGKSTGCTLTGTSAVEDGAGRALVLAQ